MSRTRRLRHWGEPGTTRDGQPSAEGLPTSDDFTREVRRRDRRARDDDARRQATGVSDPDYTPVEPKPRRLWESWRRW